MPQRIPIVENILSANDRLAAENRQMLDQQYIFALNFMASPGAGKTSLLEHTIQGLKDDLRIGVVEGDLATSLDAERAEAAGAISLQINTGGECHLDAVMFHQALAHLPLASLDVLFVENVGNLICPSAFQLGTHQSVLIASIPEGDDKPYKYPGMYRGVDVLVINKIDLLPYVDFDMDYFKRGVEVLNPNVRVFEVSCRTGQNMDAWLLWVKHEVEAFRAAEVVSP
jgi:hydrogenase nickel incorporation protein HypB